MPLALLPGGLPYLTRALPCTRRPRSLQEGRAGRPWAAPLSPLQAGGSVAFTGRRGALSMK